MKLLAFLMFTVFAVSAADSYSQSAKFSIKLKDATVREVFNHIEENSEFILLYNEKWVDVNRRVDINVKNGKVEKILDQTFKGTRNVYKIYDRQVVILEDENAEMPGVLKRMVEDKEIQQPRQKEITGKVTDTGGLPLPGVSVIVKGTTIGTVTNADGEFSLNIPLDAETLQFSFVGMHTQEVTIDGRTTFMLVMEEDIIGIEEVVAVGYGTMQKSDLTGSVIQADIESFRQFPDVSILQSMQGNVPGLNVGQVDESGENPGISIRGRTSISGSQNPLIVLDGVIYRGNLIDINSNNVESINILKDASSTAIYGSEAANGVILITTKSGKEYTGKPKISYSGQITHNTPTKILKPTRREGALQKTYDADWTNSRLAPDYIEPNPDWDIYNTFKNLQQSSGYDNGVDTDWLSLLTQNAYMQQHNVGLTGGFDNFSYNTSFGYTDQKGWLINDDYKRYNIRVNLVSQITDWLTISTQSFITNSDYSGVTPDYNSANYIYIHPLYAAFGDNGKPIPEPTGSGLNPVLAPKIDDSDKRLNLFGNVVGEITVPYVKGLSYRLTYNNTYVHNRSYYFDRYSDNFLGQGHKNHTINYSWTLDNVLEYKRTFDKHKINATLVYGREDRKYEYTEAESADFKNPILGYNSLQGGDVENQLTNSGGWEENSIYSMGRIFYSYKNRYMLTGTVRRDGFSGFGEENKFGIFPSGALGWVVSEESFMKGLQLLDYLKLRVSYGVNGNRTIGRYATLAKVRQYNAYIYGDGGATTIGQYLANLANTDLKWETTTGINLGMDFAFLNNRLFGNVDYYNTKTNDLLYNINIPQLTGFSSISTNIGELHNHGFEMVLTSVNVKSPDWNWQTSLNFSLNRNEVVSILGRDDDGDGKEDDLVSSKIFIGEPLSVIYDYEITGMYQIGDETPSGFYSGTYILND